VTCEDLCALGRIRTCNLLIRSQVLYPLSYERALPKAAGQEHSRSQQAHSVSCCLSPLLYPLLSIAIPSTCCPRPRRPVLPLFDISTTVVPGDRRRVTKGADEGAEGCPADPRAATRTVDDGKHGYIPSASWCPRLSA